MKKHCFISFLFCPTDLMQHSLMTQKHNFSSIVPEKNDWWPAASYLRLIGCGGQRWRLAALWLAGTVEGGVCCAVCYHSTVTCDVNRTNRGNGKDLNTSHRKDKTCKTSCDLCFWRFYKSTSDPWTHIQIQAELWNCRLKGSTDYKNITISAFIFWDCR